MTIYSLPNPFGEMFYLGTLPLGGERYWDLLTAVSKKDPKAEGVSQESTFRRPGFI